MTGKRITRTYTTDLPALPDRVFPLLCPTREYDWIPQWECELVYSDSGYAEMGCVFTTNLTELTGPETWVVCIFEPNKKIGFIRTGLHSTIRYEISVIPGRDESSTIQWLQEITSLSEQGDKILEATSQTAYHEKMEHLNKMLRHYLQTGEMLRE